jgi:hypothetical protein
MIRTFLTTSLATLVIATAALTAPVTPAQAHGDVGLGIAAGVIGGAIIGSAIVNSEQRTYVETPAYEDETVTCHRVLFRDDYGNRTWRRVCN